MIYFVNLCRKKYECCRLNEIEIAFWFTSEIFSFSRDWKHVVFSLRKDRNWFAAIWQLSLFWKQIYWREMITWSITSLVKIWKISRCVYFSISLSILYSFTTSFFYSCIWLHNPGRLKEAGISRAYVSVTLYPCMSRCPRNFSRVSRISDPDPATCCISVGAIISNDNLLAIKSRCFGDNLNFPLPLHWRCALDHCFLF
jgi:hypothetical protein